jgi:mRNA interferase MazF
VTYSRWDVVAVHFPFLEGTDAKRRPALIVSSDRLHKEQALFWIVMITTAKTGKRPGDIEVTNIERAGLPENCVIRVARITAVSEGQIARRLGDVTNKDRTAVIALLKQYAP